MKKVISLFLAVLMIMSSIPSLAFSIGDDPSYFKTTNVLSGGKVIGVSIAAKDNNAIYGDVVIPSIKGAQKVIEIQKNGFASCHAIKTIVIPDTVTEIGERAFAGCSDLTEITIPDSVTTIGKNAFEDCDNLKTINIGSHVVGPAEGWGFSTCPNLENINVSGGGSSVFTDSYGGLYVSGTFMGLPLKKTVEDYVISSGTKTIASHAFYGHNLKSVVIPDGVWRIGDFAFYKNGLTSLALPDTVTLVERYAFCGCENITDLYLSSTLSTVEEGAFEGCVNAELKSSFPESVTYIERCAFADCDKLKGIMLKDNVKEIGVGAFSLEADVHYSGNKKNLTTDSSIYGLHYIPSTDLNCSTSGFKYADKCDICAEWAARHVGENQHELVDSAGYVSNATCTKEGVKVLRCKHCYEEFYETIPMRPHSISRNGVCTSCYKDFTEDCGHICHKDGISGFFYKIALIFWKLFKTNMVCSCGMYHY